MNCFQIFYEFKLIKPGLILNREPYFNEAGYEKQKGGQQAAEDSRLYNEMAIVKLVQVY